MLWGTDQYILGNILLLGKYVEHLAILRKLPQDLQNPDDFNDKIREHDRLVKIKKADPVLEFVVDDGQIAEQFNKSMEKLKNRMRDFDMHTRTVPFATTITILFAIRAACILAALISPTPIWHTFLISLLQVAAAPYSVFASITMVAALVPPVFFGHYVVYGVLSALIPASLSVPFTLTNTFVILFFLIDQALCLRCAFHTALGKSVWFGWQKTFVHFAYGLLNTKSYTLLILLLLRGQTFNLIPWLIDAAFGISPLLTRFVTSKLTMHWAVLFYNQHRMAHLPRVYEHAHKFHHYLCDTNAFDAHIYGSGMPEELLCMWIEIALGLFRLPLVPTSISYQTLLISHSNKVGHTRKHNDAGGVNHHADHHTVHSKNFSIYNCLLDMYFGTNHPNNDRFFFANYIVEKVSQKVSGREMVVFRLTRTDAGLDYEELQSKYYKPGFISVVKALVQCVMNDKVE